MPLAPVLIGEVFAFHVWADDAGVERFGDGSRKSAIGLARMAVRFAA